MLRASSDEIKKELFEELPKIKKITYDDIAELFNLPFPELNRLPVAHLYKKTAL